MSAIVGTAGWSIASKDADWFDREGSGLARYASRFGGVEINSSFYRPHRQSTWQRWADSVPADFRFSVKIPKAITHERKLVDCAEASDIFCGQVEALGGKLAVLLVQLPPKLAFDKAVVASFFEHLASSTIAQIVCEPRHPSWFDDDADRLLQTLEIARVAADPALTPSAAIPGGWREFAYWRLHGSPTIYRSAYGDDRLDGYARLVRGESDAAHPAWCIFDNTASFAATQDALGLQARLS